MKAQASKRQAPGKLQSPSLGLFTRILGAWCSNSVLPWVWSLRFGASARSGYGPPTSVPPATSITRSVARSRSQLDRSNPGASRREERRLQSMPQRHRADARRLARRARLHRLPRRQSGARPNERAGARSAAQQGILENLRESAELQRLAQSRIARVHSLRESRRFARRATSLRPLP